MLKRSLFLILFTFAAHAQETISVRDAIARLRADFRVPVSFIEAESDARIAVPQPATAKALIDAITSTGSYEHVMIDDRAVIASTDRRWRTTVSGVALRQAPRMQALRAYVELARRNPELAMLRAPGILGVIGPSSQQTMEPFDDERVSLAPSARAIEHFVQLLGDAPRLVFDVRRFTWGTQPAFGITFEEVAPLAFSAAGVDRFRHYHAAAAAAGFTWREADMAKALESSRAGVREAGVFYFGLWNRRNPADAARVRKMLGDAALPVRLLAAEALARLADRSGLSTVISAAQHQSDRDLRIAGIRGTAAYAAIPSARSEAIAALAKTLGDAAREIRLATAQALSALGGDDVRELAGKAAQTEKDPDVLAALRRALGERTKP